MSQQRLVIAMILSIALSAGAASAQTNAEVNAGIQFNFSTPGARSLGLGGAFIGLADDATAAFTNPAGLTILSQPEVSLEGRSWTYTHEVPFEGHAFGPPTDFGVDSVPGIRTRDFENDTSNLSFVSFVYPRGRWAVAVYRHQLADFEAEIENQGIFLDSIVPGFENLGVVTTRFFPIRADLDLEISDFGVSAAFRVVDNLSLGIGVSYYDFEIESLTERFFTPFPDEIDVRPGEDFGPPDFSPANVVNLQEQLGDDNDVAAIAGLLWEISDRWSLGAVYRQGPEFEFTARSLFGPKNEALGGAPAGTVFAEQATEFNVPDVFGLGIAFRPTDALNITLDYDRVEYSALTENVVNIFATPEDTTAEERAALGRLQVEDADELHLGLEYVWTRLRFPVALRLGTFYDPDHKLAFEGQPDERDPQRSAAALFREGDDEYHYSVGLGVVFDEFQVDAAADFSEPVETYSLSGVYRFGG